MNVILIFIMILILVNLAIQIVKLVQEDLQLIVFRV
jgi:hypothetical protein